MPELANPTIAMGINVPSGPQYSPFELVDRFANAQRAMVEAQGARQTLAARQQLGNIFANSPDMPSAIAAAQKDPLVSGYLPDAISAYQGISNLMTTQAGAIQEQNTNALGALFQSARASVADPDSWKANAAAAFASLPPAIQQRVGTAWNGIVAAIGDGQDDPNLSPEQKRELLTQHLGAYALRSGMGASEIQTATGAMPQTITMQSNRQAGGASQPMVQGSAGLTTPPSAHFLGQPSEVPTTLTPGEAEVSKAKGEIVANTAREMSDSMAVLPNELKKMDILYDAVGKMGAGGGQEFRSGIAQSMQALGRMGVPGITQDVIDKVVNGGDLAANQTFKQEVQQVLLSQLKLAQQGLGRATAAELNTQIQSLNADSDPKTIMTIMNQIKYGMQVQYDKAQMWNKFETQRQIPGTPESMYPEDQFNTYYVDHMNSAAMPTSTGGGGNLAPQPLESVKPAIEVPSKPKSSKDIVKSIFGQ